MSPLPKFSIPASNLENKLRFPYRRERFKQEGIAVSKTPEFVVKVTKGIAAQKCRLRNCGGSFPRIPQGAPETPKE